MYTLVIRDLSAISLSQIKIYNIINWKHDGHSYRVHVAIDCMVLHTMPTINENKNIIIYSDDRDEEQTTQWVPTDVIYFINNTVCAPVNYLRHDCGNEKKRLKDRNLARSSEKILNFIFWILLISL